MYSPVDLLIETDISASSWKCLRDALAIAISKALNINSSSMPYSLETDSTTAKISILSIIYLPS